MITIEARARRLYTCHECHHLINFQNKKFPEGEFIIYDHISMRYLLTLIQIETFARACLSREPIIIITMIVSNKRCALCLSSPRKYVANYLRILHT